MVVNMSTGQVPQVFLQQVGALSSSESTKLMCPFGAQVAYVLTNCVRGREGTDHDEHGEPTGTRGFCVRLCGQLVDVSNGMFGPNALHMSMPSWLTAWTPTVNGSRTYKACMVDVSSLSLQCVPCQRYARRCKERLYMCCNSVKGATCVRYVDSGSYTLGRGVTNVTAPGLIANSECISCTCACHQSCEPATSA